MQVVVLVDEIVNLAGREGEPSDRIYSCPFQPIPPPAHSSGDAASGASSSSAAGLGAGGSGGAAGGSGSSGPGAG